MRSVLGITLIVAVFVPGMIITAAQNQPLKFEVASIKRNTNEAGGESFGARPGGRLTVVNNAISNVINNAYEIANYQLIGVPDWVNSERYDIAATGSDTASRKDVLLMLQSLLTDRFAMRAHFEKREMPAYILTVAKGGSKLRILISEDCVPFDSTKPDPLAVPNVCGDNLQNLRGQVNLWSATHISMPGVTELLSRVLRKPVMTRQVSRVPSTLIFSGLTTLCPLTLPTRRPPSTRP
jgi:uncharacterized protein (TIGR03435 family)